MFSINPLDDEINRKISCAHMKNYVEVKLHDFTIHPFRDGEKWQPKPTILIRKYENFADKIRNFEVFEDDIWVITYMKSGTTWSQEMAWLIANDLDYKAAGRIRIDKRFPFLEISGIADNDFMDSVKDVANMPRPRFIKSHLPISLLPSQLWTKKPKIIYVARNPKDVAISFYHHYKNIDGYPGTMDDLFDAILDDQVLYGPILQHILEFWRIRQENYILFLTYEEMKLDLLEVLKKATIFLNKSYADDQLMILAKHLSIDEMRKNPATNYDEFVKEIGVGVPFRFIRKGVIGSHKEEMSVKYIEKFDKWIENNLKGSGLKFIE